MHSYFSAARETFLQLVVHVNLDVFLRVRAPRAGGGAGWASRVADGSEGPWGGIPGKAAHGHILCLALGSLCVKINGLDFSEITSQRGFLL